MSTSPPHHVSPYIHSHSSNTIHPATSKSNSSPASTAASLPVFPTEMHEHALGYLYSHNKRKSTPSSNSWNHEDKNSSSASQTPSPVQPSDASEEEDVSPQLPSIDLPRTPDWFPSPLPPTRSLPVAVASQQPLHHALEQAKHTTAASPQLPPLSPSNSRFVLSPHAPVFRMQNHHAYNENKDARPHAFGIVPKPHSTIPLTESGKPSSQVRISKVDMQQKLELYVQGLPKAKLLEITNAGQLCHLKRPERVAVFLQSTVKFE